MWRLAAFSILVLAALGGTFVAAGWDLGSDWETLETEVDHFPGASAERGKLLIDRIGCGGCHQIPGIASANGLVGPPLDHMANRIYIAGLLRNTPANMVTWLRNPQAVVPGNAMPNMAISEEDARDIAAYLYTLE